jgi:Cu/Ag efflux pump CusA
VGGLLALAITGTPFSVSSGIGFLALFGVSVLTAVVYISYANELRLGGEIRHRRRQAGVRADRRRHGRARLTRCRHGT